MRKVAIGQGNDDLPGCVLDYPSFKEKGTESSVNS